MKFPGILLLIYCVLGVQSSLTANEEELLTTDIELDEFDFEELCALNTPYDWSRIVQRDYNAKAALETAENYAEAQRRAAEKFSGRLSDDSPTREPETTRKLELISRPGDVLLLPDKYKRLLNFSDQVQRTIAKKRQVCESSKSCDLTSGHPDQLLKSWTSLSIAGLDDVTKDYPRLLDLVSEAAFNNGLNNAESYWLTLSDLELDGYNVAKRLWEEVKPLYQKLHNLVATKLQKKYGNDVLPDTNSPLPLYLLGSSIGNDWSIIGNIVLTGACADTYHDIEKKMEEKDLKGKTLYQRAEMLTGFLDLGKLSKQFWVESEFNHTCPAQAVDTCHSAARVATCSASSWSNYLDAHRTVVKSAFLTDIQTKSSMSFILKSGNRYSAIYEAVGGLAEILASSRHYMAQFGLVTPTDKCALQTVLTLSALKLLPSMAYYLVADLARLQAITTNNTDNIGSIWQKLQNDVQGISTHSQEWWGFLNDPQITTNKPLINKFYAIFLQFHLFEEIMTNSEESFTDAEEFIHKKDELKKLLFNGLSKKWPKLLEEVFNIKKVTSAPLLNFFSRFESLSFLASVPTGVPKPSTTVASTQQYTNTLVIDGIKNNFTVFPNGIKKEDTNENNDKFGLGFYLLISFFGLVAVIIVIVITRYVWKRMRKSYEPPTHQNEQA